MTTDPAAAPQTVPPAPVPGCMLTVSADPATSHAMPDRLHELQSPDVGIVHRIDDAVTPYDHPRLATAYALLGNTRPVHGHAVDARAGAVAAHPAAARDAALGEAAERYSAAYAPPSRRHRLSPDALAGRPTAPPDWLDRGGAHPPVDWVSGARLRAEGTAQPAWVAASRTYLVESDEAAEIAVPTSTGLACHRNPWRALASALLEVVERDAFMVSWLTEAATTALPGHLAWDENAGSPVRFDRSIEDYQLHLLDSPTRIPVVLAVAYGQAGQPPVAVGAAAALDIITAARKALVEAQQTFAWAALMHAEGRRVDTDPSDFTSLDEHVGYYLDPDRLGAFDFLRRTDAPRRAVDLRCVGPRMDPETAVHRIVAALDRAGLNAFAVDVTAPDIRSAGLWVIRAVIPELYPLLVGRRAPDHPRVAASIARRRAPHPFP